jgi:hypothetical protein
MEDHLPQRSTIVFDWVDTLSYPCELHSSAHDQTFDSALRLLRSLREAGHRVCLSTSGAQHPEMKKLEFMPEDIFHDGSRQKGDRIRKLHSLGHHPIIYVGNSIDEVAGPALNGAHVIVFDARLEREDLSDAQISHRSSRLRRLKLEVPDFRPAFAYGFDELNVLIGLIDFRNAPKDKSQLADDGANFGIILGPLASASIADECFEIACELAEIHFPGTTSTMHDNRFKNGIVDIVRVDDVANGALPGVSISTRVPDIRENIHYLADAISKELVDRFKSRTAQPERVRLNIPIIGINPHYHPPQQQNLPSAGR